MQTRIPTRAEALDDHELLTQVWHGSEDALVTLHRRYVNPVYSLTLRILGDPMAAEEVTQDVFIKLWRHPRAYNPNKGRFSSWLLTVARHAAIDELRRNGRRPHTVTTSNGEGQRLAREQTIPKPKAAPEPYHLGIILGRLPLDQRKVIELAYFGGMSQQDIASYLDLPLGTVNTRIRLGMQKVRGVYQRESMNQESKRSYQPTFPPGLPEATHPIRSAAPSRRNLRHDRG